MTDRKSTPFQPTLLGAAWRYRFIVLLFAILFGIAGWYYASDSQTWTATASVTVQDPRSSAVFAANAELDPRRHVSNQWAIISSHAVAETAERNLAAAEPPRAVSALWIELGLAVQSASSTDVITISFSHVDPDTAIATVNAVIDAYREVSREAAANTRASAINELNAAIAEFETELTGLARQLAEEAELSASATSLETAIDNAVGELLALDVPPAADDNLALGQFSDRFAELESLINTMQAALDEVGTPTVDDAIVRQQSDLLTRLAALQLRRDELMVDAEVAGSGITFVVEARTAAPSSVAVLAVAGAIFGAMLGGALAFYLASGRRHFGDRTEPQVVLGTNLIADIPLFAEERLRTELPTVEASSSVAAESFRFVASGLAGRPQGSYSDGLPAQSTSVAIVAAAHLEGSTTVTANTALAAAQAGNRVALIDADFVGQSLTGMLVTDEPRFGLTDVAPDGSDTDAAGHQIAVSGIGTLTLFSRGIAMTESADFFASERASAIMDRLRLDYDLVLIDTPPLLRVAYSGTILRLADTTLVVVGHGGSAPNAAELRERLRTVGTPTIGYVYNRAPLRREMIRMAQQPVDQDPALSSTDAAG
ncbi:MAG: AAA family ATPase [bacterium]|nr:AAA family ATPase [bacterium]